jgi:hypothetical protein
MQLEASNQRPTIAAHAHWRPNMEKLLLQRVRSTSLPVK